MQVRLTTKFTLTAALLVLAVAALLSTIYLSTLARMVIRQADDLARFVAQQTFFQAQQALQEAARQGSGPGSASPEGVREYVRRTLDENEGVTRQVEAAVSYSPGIYEVSIVDRDGTVLISSDSSLPGRQAARRMRLEYLAGSNLLEQLRALYGPQQVFEYSYPFNLGDDAFGEIRVGYSTTLLRSEFSPGLQSAGMLVLGAVLISTLLGAFVSHATLAPLHRISKQLEQIVPRKLDQDQGLHSEGAQRGDELGQMSTNVTQISQKVRSWEEEKLSLSGRNLQIVEQLRQKEEQQRREEKQRRVELERLSSAVGHEVRNPLNSMALWLETLKGDLPIEKETAARAVKVLQSEIERLNRVVNDALIHMRPVELQVEEIKMEELVLEVLDVLKPQLVRASVELTTQWNGELPTVRVDRKLIQEAVRNLVLNAVKAMPQGGQLKVGLERRGEMLRLTITDTGCGIPAEHRDKIFQLFFSRFKEGGSGIGLASTYKTVQFHNGSIDFESEEGGGTTFRIELPLAN